MSEAVEQDYIGLSVSSSSSNSCHGDEKNSVLNLKETELRLGLPGSESPERRSGPTVLFGKSLGAKRGFSDAIDESGKWDLSMDTGSDVGFGKDEVLLAEIGGKEVKGGPVVAVKPSEEKKNAPASKAQVVGWPPIRSFRKNALAPNLPKNSDTEAKSGQSCLFVKVSMDGAPYLRKVDLKTYSNYAQLSSALEKLFSCFTIGRCSTDELLEKEGSKENFHGSEHVLTYEDKDGDWMLVGDVPWEMFIGSCKRLRIMRGSEAIGLAPRSTQKVKTQN